MPPIPKANKTTMYLNLTSFRLASPCHNQATKITAFKENYQQPANVARTIAQSRRILKWLKCSRGLAISK
jgi:hypothetical protein